MKATLVIIILTCFCCLSANAHTNVHGYYRKDGTYVNGYKRTSPNSTRFDNFSTKGNINPYTFQKGYKNPYDTPKFNYGKSLINKRNF